MKPGETEYDFSELDKESDETPSTNDCEHCNPEKLVRIVSIDEIAKALDEVAPLYMEPLKEFLLKGDDNN